MDLETKQFNYRNGLINMVVFSTTCFVLKFCIKYILTHGS